MVGLERLLDIGDSDIAMMEAIIPHVSAKVKIRRRTKQPTRSQVYHHPLENRNHESLPMPRPYQPRFRTRETVHGEIMEEGSPASSRAEWLRCKSCVYSGILVSLESSDFGDEEYKFTLFQPIPLSPCWKCQDPWTSCG